jgi:GR25 family glycosyltransferase involved in LPS biosynthesis
MKVGVTTNIQFSLFSGGTGATSLAVAELYKNTGNEVWLINTNPDVSWWDDCSSMKKTWENTIISLRDIQAGTLPGGSKLDLLIEVDKTAMNSAADRAALATHCIWLVRKSAVFRDIESSLYPIDNSRRNVDGLSAVWAFDLTNTQDDLKYLELIGRCPVYVVPFLWTPSCIEVHRAETKAPEWIQVTEQLGQGKSWNVHICETNNTAASSVTLPLVILRDAKKRGFDVKKWITHNTDHVLKSDFFKNNVKKHCEIEDLSGEFVGRQRVIDWIFDAKSCILSHSRFTVLRPFQLDAAWTGIPMVHNSLWLRELTGSGYDRLYYPDNSVTGGTEALERMSADFTAKQGLFTNDARNLTRQAILARLSPYSQSVCEQWITVTNKILQKAAPVASVASAAFVASVPLTKSAQRDDPLLGIRRRTVIFTDMWDGFNPSYNMFLLMMNEAGRHLTPPVRVEGVSSGPADLCIFGPFGQTWCSIDAAIPKVHYTGENSPALGNKEVVLNLGYHHADFVDQAYMRLPLWMLEVDWFAANKELLNNPKPLPIDWCTQVHPENLMRKKNFCAFVVTNPCNEVRNNAFKTLTQYKQVDSAGRLYNNIGDEIFAGLGGGGGELKKFEFLKSYKFCLAYENSSSQGYTTEKFLHAKAAGCIPIYWGDPKVERDFDPAGFIDARNMKDPSELIEAVRKVDQNASEWLKMFSVPALDDTRRDMARRTLSECSRRLLKLTLGSDEGLAAIPRFLGATSDAEAIESAKIRESIGPSLAVVPAAAAALPVSQLQVITKSTMPNQIKKVTVATYATQRFLPSLNQWLAAMTAQKNNSSLELEAHVWLGSDVSKDTQDEVSKAYSWVTIRHFPTELTVPRFPDIWESQHFAWKLYILNELASAENQKGRTVLYTDSGVFMCRWPVDFLQIAQERGACFFQDPRETNGRWCHEVFCKAMGVTETEKQDQQIWAGSLAFVAGASVVTKMFAEAWTWGQRREVIVGPKWSGVGADGKPFGHRHDQSILSILTARAGFVRYPLDEVYCDESLRRCFLSRKAFYVHRGLFQVHKQFSQGIDDCYVINLDRRADRMEKLYTNSPELKGRLQRVSAFEGKALTLTPAIARLFRPHDFKWKKPVMGCALSHLSLWWQLANEREDIDKYLILEDDAKLAPNWEKRWQDAVPHIPEDADIVYLGGILPPNRAGFEKVKHRINDHISKVGDNAVFGQNPPNAYFHWCAYAYVLTKNGARKVIEILKAKDGYWTSADHMLCNLVGVMNMYFLDPLVAGCYQDDDPRYQNSAFNDFSRVDGFDSDLWNNTDAFDLDEAKSLSMNGAPLDIQAALNDAKNGVIRENQVGSETKSSAQSTLQKEVDSPWIQLVAAVKTNELEKARDIAFKLIETWKEVPSPVERAAFLTALSCKTFAGLPKKDILKILHSKWQVINETLGLDGITERLEVLLKYVEPTVLPPVGKGRRVLAHDQVTPNALFEIHWLRELFGDEQSMEFTPITFDAAPPKDIPMIIVSRPWWQEWMTLMERWSAAGSKFYALHLADEHGEDPLAFYGLPGCLGVIRSYTRPETEVYGDKVVTIPLGYHWTAGQGMDDPEFRTPRLPFRELVWSFHGTNWRNREDKMKNMLNIKPYALQWFKEWNDAANLKKDDYLSYLMNSRFIPTPGGTNPETYRFYECLECGCIPIYVRQAGDELYYEKYVKKWIPLVDLPSWDHAAAFVFQLDSNPPLMEQYRSQILQGYARWKKSLKAQVAAMISLKKD